MSLHDEHAVGSLTKADLLLERVKTVYKIFSPEQCENLLIAFSQVMDEAYRRRPFDQRSVNSLWERAQSLVPLLLSHLEPKRREATLTRIFTEGKAIGWLTSLFRKETFAHGRFGDKLRPKKAWLFTDVELDGITVVMISRYRAMSGDDVFDCPNPINILFAWMQAGDEEGPRQLISANTASDEGLVETLEHLTSTVNSSDRGKYVVLTKESISYFLDYEHVRKRIEALKNDSKLGERASMLATAFDYDDRE